MSSIIISLHNENSWICVFFLQELRVAARTISVTLELVVLLRIVRGGIMTCVPSCRSCVCTRSNRSLTFLHVTAYMYRTIEHR
jgi:hypothetical protein